MNSRRSSPAGRLRTAVIGTGFVGPHHVDAVRRTGYADVVAIAGSDPSARSSPAAGRTATAAGRARSGRREIVDRHLGDPFFGIFLNAGHQIHLDEWVNSPVAVGSTIELRSGMAFQVDIIPATGTGYFTTNIEDDVALADQALRDAFAASYPGAWERIQAWRRFMADALGIALHPDVPPFSNIPTYLAPFLLRPDRAMTVAA